MAFNALNLHPQLLSAITELGYTEPTDIQLEAIPIIMQGSDIRASAQTGTGKTAAFLLPLLHHLATSERVSKRGPRALILVPTRELALQITVQAEKYSKHLKTIKVVCISGGVPYYLQSRQISKPYDILIATPGRLIDYMEQGKIDCSQLELLVLDEADRMLDMGFLEPVEQIVAQSPDSRQTLLFSATLQKNVIQLSERLLKNPVDIVIDAEQVSHENIEQQLHFVDNLGHKSRLLDRLLSGGNIEHSIIFTSTKRHADQLVKELHVKGHRVAALHGDMSQGKRTHTIAQLRKGNIKTLIATDIAARGLDVHHITHVINFDLPRNIEDYVHRIGRTGRAGAKGTALSFVAERDMPLLTRIEKYTGKKMNVIEVEGFEAKVQPQENPAPSKNRSNRSRPRSGGGGHRFKQEGAGSAYPRPGKSKSRFSKFKSQRAR